MYVHCVYTPCMVQYSVLLYYLPCTTGNHVSNPIPHSTYHMTHTPTIMRMCAASGLYQMALQLLHLQYTHEDDISTHTHTVYHKDAQYCGSTSVFIYIPRVLFPETTQNEHGLPTRCSSPSNVLYSFHDPHTMPLDKKPLFHASPLVVVSCRGS